MVRLFQFSIGIRAVRLDIANRVRYHRCPYAVPAMKLNLPNYDCVRFVVEASLNVPAEHEAAIRAIVGATLSNVHAPVSDDVDGLTVAVFGSKFVFGDVNYQATGTLSVAQRGPVNKADVLLITQKASDTLTRPPRTIKSVTALTEAAERLFDRGVVECNATFEYSLSKGYVSRIVFPIPLIRPARHGGITHIEKAEFSSRSDDAIEYRVFVSNDEEHDALEHAVHFAMESDLNRRSLRGLLGKASAISRQLLVQEREG